MPFSQCSQISTIVGFMVEARPRSILDVGVGMGQYGMLARLHVENNDLFEINGSEGRLKDKAEWWLRLDGIEGCPIYLTPVTEYLYNQIHVGEALSVLRSLPDRRYEMVLAIDILEHFEPRDGECFLAEIRRVASRYAVVSTPKEFIEQRVEPNPYEDHRSLWTDHDLISRGFDLVLENAASWIAVSRRMGA